MENSTETKSDSQNTQNKVEITIKSGSKNKSINHYVSKISRNILDKSQLIELNAIGKFFCLKRIIT